MTGNRTTELLQEIRSLLDERGVDYNEYSRVNSHAFAIDYCDACGDYLSEIEVYGACICATKKYLTPEQAIAATLGSEINGETYARANNGSRWFELFGTPERAVQTLYEFDPHTSCRDCPFRGACGDEGAGCIYERSHDALLEWLSGDAR
jgi:hypothetical protein